MKTFVIIYNRLWIPKTMCEWLSVRGCDIIIVDNHSDYEPLLAWYASKPFEIVHMANNYGHCVVWDSGMLDHFLASGERYILTDPDLDLSGVPDDFVTILGRGLDEYPHKPKCGLSLEVNDLPNTTEGNLVRNQFERNMWNHPLDAQYFDAKTDTTLALYQHDVRHHTIEGMRTNRPYTARHVPWYYSDFNALPVDEQHYFRTANESSSGKKRLMK